jgi:hypothetical protein
VAQYDFAELEWLWIHAGGGVLYAPTAAAIALAESGGCQYALAGPIDVRPVVKCTYRMTPTENSFGLWQINLMAHPDLFNVQLFNALTNAHAAVEIADGGRSFAAWSTYTSGAYKQHMPKVVPAPKPAREDAVLGPPLQPGLIADSAAPGREHNLEQAWAAFAHHLGRGMPTALRRATYYRHLIRSAVK